MNRTVNAEASSATTTATPITMPAIAPPERGLEFGGSGDGDAKSDAGEVDDVVVTTAREVLIGMLGVLDVDTLPGGLLMKPSVTTTSGGIEELDGEDAVIGRKIIPSADTLLVASSGEMYMGPLSIPSLLITAAVAIVLIPSVKEAVKVVDVSWRFRSV